MLFAARRPRIPTENPGTLGLGDCENLARKNGKNPESNSLKIKTSLSILGGWGKDEGEEEEGGRNP